MDFFDIYHGVRKILGVELPSGVREISGPKNTGPRVYVEPLLQSENGEGTRVCSSHGDCFGQGRLPINPRKIADAIQTAND